MLFLLTINAYEFDSRIRIRHTEFLSHALILVFFSLVRGYSEFMRRGLEKGRIGRNGWMCGCRQRVTVMTKFFQRLVSLMEKEIHF